MTAPRPWWEFPDEADEDASEAPDAPVAEEAKAGEGSRCKSLRGAGANCHRGCFGEQRCYGRRLRELKRA